MKIDKEAEIARTGFNSHRPKNVLRHVKKRDCKTEFYKDQNDFIKVKHEKWTGK